MNKHGALKAKQEFKTPKDQYSLDILFSTAVCQVCHTASKHIRGSYMQPKTGMQCFFSKAHTVIVKIVLFVVQIFTSISVMYEYI